MPRPALDCLFLAATLASLCAGCVQPKSIGALDAGGAGNVSEDEAGAVPGDIYRDAAGTDAEATAGGPDGGLADLPSGMADAFADSAGRADAGPNNPEASSGAALGTRCQRATDCA